MRRQCIWNIIVTGNRTLIAWREWSRSRNRIQLLVFHIIKWESKLWFLMIIKWKLANTKKHAIRGDVPAIHSQIQILRSWIWKPNFRPIPSIMKRIPLAKRFWSSDKMLLKLFHKSNKILYTITYLEKQNMVIGLPKMSKRRPESEVPTRDYNPWSSLLQGIHSPAWFVWR